MFVYSFEKCDVSDKMFLSLFLRLMKKSLRFEPFSKIDETVNDYFDKIQVWAERYMPKCNGKTSLFINKLSKRLFAVKLKIMEKL